MKKAVRLLRDDLVIRPDEKITLIVQRPTPQTDHPTFNGRLILIGDFVRVKEKPTSEVPPLTLRQERQWGDGSQCGTVCLISITQDQKILGFIPMDEPGRFGPTGIQVTLNAYDIIDHVTSIKNGA